MAFIPVISDWPHLMLCNVNNIMLLYYFAEGGDVLYEINVHTGDVGFAGTDATIYIQLQGDKSNSKSINLSEIRGNYENPFEKNQTDIFQVKQSQGLSCLYSTPLRAGTIINRKWLTILISLF